MNNRYVLLTAAKNEETYIGETIASVLRQTVLPQAWFIMDDGSTDRTANIIQDFARENPFIRLVKREAAVKRNFGAQYRALQAGYELSRPLDFDFIGFQDADIAPKSPEYYESLLAKFRDKPRLGIAGGYVYERYAGAWRSREDNSEDSVAGGIQMFRRVCFEQIGGYIPLVYGGSDWLAQLDARLAGWEARAFPEFPAFHYRPTSSAEGKWRGLFRVGMMDASFGSALLFQGLKCVRRIWCRPLVLGALGRFSGYVWWRISGRGLLIPPEKAAFLRREQMTKIRLWVRFGGRKPAAHHSSIT
jgi:glycosyltransferase involved in cell wall biosynthesis